MIAITLIAGVGVFGFINGQSSSSAQAVGNSAANNINFLNEKEVLLEANMSSVSHAAIWVYNNGQINPETMSSVIVKDDSVSSTVCTVPVSAPVNQFQVTKITVLLPSSCTTGPNKLQLVSGHSYTFLVTGQYGSSAQLLVKL